MLRSFVLSAALVSALQAVPVFQPIQAFESSLAQPFGALCVGGDGNLYGVCSAGGSAGVGGVFRTTPEGAITKIADFSFPDVAKAGLARGYDNYLYTASTYGGADGLGSVLKVSLGGNVTVFTGFQGSGSVHPTGPLALGAFGWEMLGTASDEADATKGTIFKVTSTGVITTIAKFDVPLSPLTSMGDAGVYGVMGRKSIPYRAAQLFFRTPGGVVTIIGQLPDPIEDGVAPGGPIFAPTVTWNGTVYGTIAANQDYQRALLYRIDRDGHATPIHTFKYQEGNCVGPLVQSDDGMLRGLTNRIAYHIDPADDSFTIDHEFIYPAVPGMNTSPTVVPGGVWGTTEGGGNSSNPGTVFKIGLANEFTSLGALDASSLWFPSDGVTQDKNGNFHTFTSTGGASGAGSLARITPTGVLSRTADLDATTGLHPSASPVTGRDGNVYATTLDGGSGGKGAMLRITPEGGLSTVIDFATTGFQKPGGLTVGNDGFFYSTASGSASPEVSSILRLSSSGRNSLLAQLGAYSPYDGPPVLVQTKDRALHGMFAGNLLEDGRLLFHCNSRGVVKKDPPLALADGTQLGGYVIDRGHMAAAADGTLYGLADRDGREDRRCIFEIAPGGSPTVLLGEFPENIFPDSELIIAKDGNLYGTASGGEAPGYNGVVFRVASSGEFKVIHYFDFRHGSSPNGPLFQAADGHLYGTTRGGGTSAEGKLAGGGQFYRIWLGALAQADEATAATWNSATLHGTVDPGEYPTTVSFQYGTDPGLVRFANVKGGTVPAGDPASVSATVRVLPGRTYYFRVVTLNAENPVPQASEIRSFTTPRRPSLRELLGLRGGP